MHGISSSTSWPAAQGAPPLFATPRDPSRPSEGAQIATVARSLGTPLLPWQQHVADVATERRPDGSYEYETIVVSVPRQTGKTTLIRAMGVHRAGVLGRNVHYTAQTGKDARARWADHKTIVEKSPVWSSKIDITLRGGAECVMFHGNAGFHCFAPGPNCLHGYTPHVVVLDEAFAHDPERGDMLMGAISPAQQTILAKQIWIVSTAGTAVSTFLHDWIERGLDREPRVALFLWAAADDQDPYTAEGVQAFHPGVGFHLNEKVLTAEDVLTEIGKNTRAEYERAFGNRRTLTVSNLIRPETWRDLPGGLTAPADTRELTLTYDVALDRLSSAIMATWVTADGLPVGKVIQAGPGAGWLTAAVDKLATSWRPVALAAAGNGPVLEVTAQLRNRGHDVEELGEREYATACGAFLTLIDDAALGHDDDDNLERSVVGLVTRPGAVDGVAFSRRHSVGDSSLAIALVVGIWISTRDQGAGKPVLNFGAA